MKEVTLVLAVLSGERNRGVDCQSSPRYIACNDHRLYQSSRSKLDENVIPYKFPILSLGYHWTKLLRMGNLQNPGTSNWCRMLRTSRCKALYRRNCLLSCREVRRGTNRDLVERRALRDTMGGCYRSRT